MSAPTEDYTKQLTSGAWFNAARVLPEDGQKIYLWFGHSVKLGEKRRSSAFYQEGRVVIQMLFSHVIAWKELEK